MKTNKFFAVALAALALVSFNACNKKTEPTPSDEEATLALNPTSVQLEVGKTETITATVEATWTSSDATVASVAPGNDGGKSALVTALKEGNAVISATTKGGQTKTCVVVVKSSGGQGGKGSLKGSQIWPIILDGTTADASGGKIVATFQPNDVDQFLYVWENTYAGGNATGLNFHGNSDGYMALVVGDAGWAGAGFCLTDKGNGWQPAEDLRKAIVAAPDDYFLHMAIKSTDNYSHCFYIMGSEATKFVLGSTGVYDGKVYENFTRDGAWHEYDIPMSRFASALAGTTCAAGVNVFVMLSEGVKGNQLNLDAVYFYKK